MPPLCAIDTCKRKSRALCHCCNKDLCTDHFKEHDDAINSQVHPLVDEINTVADQFLKINIDDVIGNCRRKLDIWREDCHTLIDQFYEEKCEELRQRCVEKITKQQKEIDEIKAKINKLVRENEAIYEDIPSLKANVNDLKRDVKQFEEKAIIVDVHPLTIKQDLVYIEEWSSNEIDISTLPPPFQTIDCSHFLLASNRQFLLLYQHPNLCLFDRDLTLVKQSPWEHDAIWEICWSSTLNSFIIISSEQELFLVDENLTSIQPIETIEKKKWLSFTCSDSILFLSTNGVGSNIFEFNLLSSFRLIKQWKSPESCEFNEIIYNIAYNNETLALIIENTLNNQVGIELRSSTTLDQFWSLPLDITNVRGGIVYRVCPLRCDEWLVIDRNTSRLLYISKDGELKTTRAYTSKPYNVVSFGSNILAIEAENGVDFYRV
jgi:FtsZ-binding cell division protein ZapB